MHDRFWGTFCVFKEFDTILKAFSENFGGSFETFGSIWEHFGIWEH